MKNYNKILEAINKGIQLALDDFEDIENNSISGDIISTKDVIADRAKIDKLTVDLGLPSGTRWAKYNLGVDPNKLSKPEDWYGDYYAWGEIIPNKPDGYNWKTYQFGEDLIKYNEEDHLNELQFMDDAAYQNMHLYNFKFKMPTKKQFDELLRYTTNEWIRNYKNINGLNGRLFKGKNGTELLMPAAGFCNDSDLNYVGEEGNYWSSRLDADCPNNAWYLYFNDAEVCMSSDDRYNGFSVRPVINLK